MHGQSVDRRYNRSKKSTPTCVPSSLIVSLEGKTVNVRVPFTPAARGPSRSRLELGSRLGVRSLSFSGSIRRPTRSRRCQLGQNPASSVKARLGANGQTGIFLWIQTDLSGKTNDNGETIALDSPSKLEWKCQASLPPAWPRSKVRHGREDRLNSFGNVVFSSRSRSTPASNRPGRFFWACPAAVGGGLVGFAGAFPRFSGSP